MKLGSATFFFKEETYAIEVAESSSATTGFIGWKVVVKTEPNHQIQ